MSATYEGNSQRINNRIVNNEIKMKMNYRSTANGSVLQTDVVKFLTYEILIRFSILFHYLFDPTKSNLDSNLANK